MSSSTLVNMVSLSSFVPYLLFIPLSVYGNIKLYKCKNELFVQKRNISIALGLNCSFIFAMIASCLAHLSILYLNTISITISISIFFAAYWILLFFLNTKNFLIYYHAKWTKYALDLKWQQIINPAVKKSENTSNWFIKNRHKYGNRRYIFKLFGVLHIFGLLLFISNQIILITSGGHPNAITFSIIMIIITIIPYILFYVFLVFKTPRFNDIFNIHWESQIHARLIVIMGIGLITFNMWYAIEFRKEEISKIWAMLCFPFVSFILFIMIMVSTFFIIKKTEKIEAMSLFHTAVRAPIPIAVRQSSVTQNGKKRNSSKGRLSINGVDKKMYTLDLILSNKKSFHLFMVHLSKEFSMECLLAFVELTQFQQYIIENNINNGKIEEETIKKLKLIQFPSSIPMSKIIEDDINVCKFNKVQNNAYDYKLKAHKLFDKYIKIGSLYEINLSYQQRNSWMNMMSTTSNLWSFMHIKVDLNKLLLLIEECKSTMTKLLNHSLNRFKAYTKFEEVVQIFNTHNRINTNTIIPSFTKKGRESTTDISIYAHSSHISQNSRLSAIFSRLPQMRIQKSFSKSTSQSAMIDTNIVCIQEGNEEENHGTDNKHNEDNVDNTENTENNEANQENPKLNPETQSVKSVTSMTSSVISMVSAQSTLRSDQPSQPSSNFPLQTGMEPIYSDPEI